MMEAVTEGQQVVYVGSYYEEDLHNAPGTVVHVDDRGLILVQFNEPRMTVACYPDELEDSCA